VAPADRRLTDVTKGLPFPDGRFAGIFTEHCIEHLPLDAVHALFRECHRVLAPGGTIRIIVPDGELYLRRYLDLAQHQASPPIPYAEEDSFDGLYTPIMSVNRIFSGSGHRFIQDFETLQLLLTRNGFEDVTRESFGTGRDRTLLRPESMWPRNTRASPVSQRSPRRFGAHRRAQARRQRPR
jgi:predicted SAM-dependent methyltransferase